MEGPPLYCLLRRKPAGVLFLLLIILVFFNTFCLSQNLVEYLPGFPGKLPFKIETGYIGVGENEEVQLFYYFIESERNPEDDPVMLWLTGGPGCSCLFALFYEHGPLAFDLLNSSESLPSILLREYSWTKVASIIYLDQPVGTGFSYAKTREASYSNDTSSAKLSYEFLKKWLLKHPKYIDNPVYIGGDSYSGTTVPILTHEVYKGIDSGTKPLINMQGYLLGNPHTDDFSDLNERYTYAYRMGLLSDRLYHSAYANCNGNFLIVDPQNILCLNDLERIYPCLDRINDEMILEPACDSEDVLSLDLPSSEEIPTNFLQSVVAPRKTPTCRKALLTVVNKWLSHKSVWKALHVRMETKEECRRCNSSIQNNIPGPDGTVLYVRNVNNTVGYHKEFTRRNCRALVYSGDHDMVFPHSSTEKWIENLKVPILSDWRPWFVRTQIAGYTMTYGHGNYEMTYATVKGAGHIAPEYKHVECFDMITRWLDKRSL